MIGTWIDTILNVVVFAYVGWLIRLWLQPARGPLMPNDVRRENDGA